MDFNLKSNGSTSLYSPKPRTTSKASRLFLENYSSAHHTDVGNNQLFESVTTNPKNTHASPIDEYSSLQNRKENTLPAKYPDLFSYGAERVDYYDE